MMKTLIIFFLLGQCLGLLSSSSPNLITSLLSPPSPPSTWPFRSSGEFSSCWSLIAGQFSSCLARRISRKTEHHWEIKRGRRAHTFLSRCCTMTLLIFDHRGNQAQSPDLSVNLSRTLAEMWIISGTRLYTGSFYEYCSVRVFKGNRTWIRSNMG